MTRRLAGLLVAAAVLSGCAEGDAVQRQPVTGDDGVQATGRLDGRRIAISSGAPDVVLGDCDAGDGLDRDLCLNVRTIDGITLNLVVENPDALPPGERLPVRDSGCVAVACDDVVDRAVVDVRVAGRQVRATGGSLTLGRLDARAVGRFDLRLPDGDGLLGTFDVPLP